MSKKLFIIGTNTDVGKTYITGLILKKLHDHGYKAAYYKAAASGNEYDQNKQLIPGDCSFVKNVSKIDQSLDSMCPYLYKQALSPHLAAKLEGNPVELDTVLTGLEALYSNYDYITMEGSGGIICPIRDDETKIWLTDIIKAGDFDCLLISDASLGTINATCLTISYLDSLNINVNGIIFNHFQPGNIMHEDNLKMCEKFTNVKVVATVKDNDTDLDLDLDKLIALYKKSEV